MIRGIGPVYARKLVGAFGEKVFDGIEAQPERLREVTGIGPMRARRITDAWAEQKVVREIMVFLHENGVGTARAVRIYKTYGADAVQAMTENPYRLGRDIRGIGFKTADAIAMKLGIEKSAMIRVRSGISFALTEAMEGGVADCRPSACPPRRSNPISSSSGASRRSHALAGSENGGGTDPRLRVRHRPKERQICWRPVAGGQSPTFSLGRWHVGVDGRIPVQHRRAPRGARHTRPAAVAPAGNGRRPNRGSSFAPVALGPAQYLGPRWIADSDDPRSVEPQVNPLA
jgi:hypothetical protein